MASDDITEIREFARRDDEAYEACVKQLSGYVLTQRNRSGEEFMLHEAACSHLQLTPGEWSLTMRPRRWAQTREPLVRWAEERTGNRPLLCQSCM